MKPVIKRYLWIALVCTLFLVSCGRTNQKNNAESTPKPDIKYDTTINFISFSDFHGAVDNTTSSKNPGIDKFASVVKGYTSKESKEQGYIVVSGGDSYQGTAMSNLTKGKVISEFYKEIGVAYSAIGNHEYDWGSGNFKTWEDEGGFTFLAANIVNKENQELVDYVKPYAIIEKNDRRIGIIGIATPETSATTLIDNVKDLEFLNPVDIVNKYAKKLRVEEKVDAVVVLSHLGSTEDENGVIGGEVAALAKGVNGVDAILCGHTHNSIKGKVNNIAIVGTANNGRELGILSLEFTGDVLTTSVQLNNLVDQVDTLPSDENTKAIYSKYEEQLSPMLNQVITSLPMNLTHEMYNGQTDLGQFCSKLLTEISGCQIGLFNGGGIRTSLEIGDLTVGDMYTVFPFDNTIVTMELSGADLKSNLEHGLNPDNGIGILQYYGINVTLNTKKPIGERIESITLLDGTKVEMNKYYTVATNNFMASNGDGYDFSNAKNVVDDGLVLRDAMIQSLQEKDVIKFKKEKNYVEK